jgi:nitrite reductase/ring-hydroxylating ferredoxin subunit/uncharacterized membrane protein
MQLTRILRTTVDKIEQATWLDPEANMVASLARRLLPRGPIRNAASGAGLGHPLHPALVTVPLGAWSAATYLDVAGGPGRRQAARHLIGFGNAVAVPTALAGANDWIDTSGAEKRVGFVHALLNDAALTLFVGSWLARRRGHQVKGVALSLAGTATVAAAGWLGGHLAYSLGVGVDTTAFQHAPLDWTDVTAESEVVEGRPLLAQAAGVPVMLLRHDNGIIALADRCTHRGGPLHEGMIDDGSITCPLHHSRFHLADGAVQLGPATHPLPVYEVRTGEGRVQVRHSQEPRTLRTSPVGV